ncbi:MAG: methylated-DNA--[protein]-cysteine S-methyltransferase [Candidatus Hydrothermae bacterium]|nr:methylated-DNA--[protein]-cysteine S-methyltransferase [Candidatus Hydrothermae bacterium]
MGRHHHGLLPFLDGTTAEICATHEGILRLRFPGRTTLPHADTFLLRLPWGEAFLQAWHRYIAGQPESFQQVPVLFPESTAFQRQVYRTLRTRVPWGVWVTYGDLARQLGRPPQAARAVGQSLRKNPVPVVIPCHRVLSRQGIGGYGPGVTWKRRLLRHEGISLPPLRD